MTEKSQAKALLYAHKNTKTTLNWPNQSRAERQQQQDARVNSQFEREENAKIYSLISPLPPTQSLIISSQPKKTVHLDQECVMRDFHPAHKVTLTDEEGETNVCYWSHEIIRMKFESNLYNIDSYAYSKLMCTNKHYIDL